MPPGEVPGNQKPNHYQVLGLEKELPQNVTPEMIKKSYWEKAKKIHPEKVALALGRKLNPAEENEAKEKMQRLNLAYEVLKDPFKKAQYDRELRSRETQQKETEFVEDPEDVRFFISIIRRYRSEDNNIKLQEIDVLNRTPLNELESWEKVFQAYRGRMKTLYPKEFSDFSNILLDKRSFPASFWLVVKAINKHDEIIIRAGNLTEVKSAWEKYQRKYPTEKWFKEKVRSYIIKAEAMSSAIKKQLTRALISNLGKRLGN